MKTQIHDLLLCHEKYLEKRSVFSIVASLGKLSLRWLNKNYSFRKIAVHRLVGKSRYTESMAHQLLDALFHELTAAKLLRLLKAELKDPLALDRFRRDALTGKRQRARGPRVVTHIFSGNVPNPSIVSFILGMLIKSVNIGKVSSRDEGFLDIYLESLKSSDKNLAETNWLIDASDKRLTISAIAMSDLVVAYGNDVSLKEIRAHVPAAVPFMGYGHRTSFGIYAKEALTQKNLKTFAERTARDIWMMDQRGCLSPMEILIEAGGAVSLAGFSGALTKAIEGLFAVKAWRLPAGQAAHLIGFGGRKMIGVRPIKDLKEVSKIFMPFQKHLQSVSLEAGAERRKKTAERLSAMGVNRICRAGRMQRPPLTWHHDGKWNLAAWVNWTDLET